MSPTALLQDFLSNLKEGVYFLGIDTGMYVQPFLRYLDSFLIFFKKKKKGKCEPREKRKGGGEKMISFARLEFGGSVHICFAKRGS